MILGIDASRANVAHRTGTERYAFEVIRRILNQVPQHRVRLYVREPLRSDWGDLPNTVEVRVLSWSVGVLWTHIRLSWELFWHRPDVLFVPADTVPLFHPRKTISTIHDVAFERFPELYRQASVQRRLGWLRPLIHVAVRIVTLGRYSASERDYHRWSARQAVRSCSQLLTVSEFSKQEIVHFLKANPENIAVTPLGVRPPEFFSQISPKHCTDVLRALKLQRPYFLFIGRLESKKNIRYILESFVRYRQSGAMSHDLVLVGSPGYGWDEAVSALGGGLPEGIHLLGWQSDDVVDALLIQARALVLVSQYEGFGIPALEALSAGTEVIASRHGSLPEILGTYARYVATEEPEALSQAFLDCANQSYDASRRSAGERHARQFTWDETAVRTLPYLTT